MICLNKIPLFNEKCSLYTGGICHKNFLIFLDPGNCQIDIFTHCLKKIDSIKTDKYQSITENKKDCYFILTKENDKNYLYKATHDFLEFDSIELHIPNKYKATINDIYYDEKERQIVIATNDYLYTITLDGYFIKEIASHVVTRNNIIIQNLNGCCRRAYIPATCSPQYTAVGHCQHLYIANKEKENTCLKTMEEENCPMDSICLGSNIKIVSIFVCCNRLYLLVIKNDRYNYLYETDICCTSCKDSIPCCNCEYKKCPPCCTCHDNHCHHHCQNPAACLLESVALVETSLSHILNAEGEKIQKAIADDASICELLEINNSVTESIFNVTMLEHVLQKKMEKALQYDECHHPCHDNK